MRYEIHGFYLGNPVNVVWENGKLSDDMEGLAVGAIELEAYALDGEPVGPVGQYVYTNYLKDPLASMFLITSVIGADGNASGDVPEPADVPSDAVI